LKVPREREGEREFKKGGEIGDNKNPPRVNPDGGINSKKWQAQMNVSRRRGTERKEAGGDCWPRFAIFRTLTCCSSTSDRRREFIKRGKNILIDLHTTVRTNSRVNSVLKILADPTRGHDKDRGEGERDGNRETLLEISTEIFRHKPCRQQEEQVSKGGAERRKIQARAPKFSDTSMTGKNQHKVEKGGVCGKICQPIMDQPMQTSV